MRFIFGDLENRNVGIFLVLRRKTGGKAKAVGAALIAIDSVMSEIL